MSSDVLDHPLGDVFADLSAVDMPMFLVLVEADGRFRFGGLNAAHERATGLRSAEIEGRSPEEALPPRMAETILANYRKCRNRDGPYSYEEKLVLRTGPRWWRTTLVPLRSGRRIVALIGTSVDISDAKAGAIGDDDQAAALRRRAADLEAVASASVAAVRGPLNNIVSLCRMLRTELRPPLQRKVQILNMLVETAVYAIGSLDEIDDDSTSIHGAQRHTRADWGHMCRTFAAIADPERALQISFARAEVETHRETLEPVMEALIVAAAGAAQSWVSLSLRQTSLTPPMLGITLSCDALDGTRLMGPMIQGRVEACGGSVQVDPTPEAGVEVTLTLPGLVLRSRPDPDP